MRHGLTVLIAIGLGACGGDQPDRQAVTNQPQIAVRSPEQNRLHQLDTMARDIGLKRAIQDSGLRCRRVTRSGYVQEFNTLSMWTADCEDRRSWAIFVGPDGSAQVRPCGDSAKLGLPQCRVAADPTGRTARAAQGTPAR